MNQQGEVLARGKGIFIAIDPEKMFGKFVERIAVESGRRETQPDAGAPKRLLK